MKQMIQEVSDRKFKKVIVFLLLFSLVINLSNGFVSDAAETSNIVAGKCGENVYYELNKSTGTLRIYGKGKMSDYGKNIDDYYAPWIKEYKSVIKQVSIESGITSIGDAAFSGSIYNSSWVCENLSQLKIAETVTEIGEGAFCCCKNLKNIVIPNSVTTIKRNAFGGTSLSDITWGSSVQTVEKEAFYNTKIVDLNLPSKVYNIGERAFGFCRNLENANVPDNCEVGYQAFAYCNELKNIIFGKNCKLHGEIFRECSSLTSISLSEGDISVSDESNSPDYGTFKECTGLQSILLPDSWGFDDGTEDTFAYSRQFIGCTNLKNISINSTNKKYKKIDGVICSKDKSELVYYPFYLISSEYEMPDSITTIAPHAFENQKYLQHITFSSNINKIGWGAFYGCDKLNNVILPEGLVELTGFVFGNCTSLESIVLPASLKNIHSNYKAPDESFGPETRSVLRAIYGEKDSYAEQWADAEQWPKEKFKETIYCSFDANGGIVDIGKKPVIYGDKYHKLPIPTREGYKFLGWYSKRDSGNEISSDMLVSTDISHTLYAHWGIDSTVRKSIADTVITLEKINYTYDGTEKKPSVNVKDGSVTLINGVDYTISYVDNIEAGVATVIINGIGNYSGTVSKTFTISLKQKDFVWNKDNWNFNNSSYQGYFSSGKMIEQIDSTYLTELKNNLTNSEYRAIFDSRDGWLYDDWGGSCYGMSSTSFLAMENFLPYSKYKQGATNLYQLSYPLMDSNVSSLITYYQMLQVKDVIQQQYRTIPSKSNKENIQNIISLLDMNNTVLVGFKKAGWGGHAVLAYGYEYGSYTWNGVSYQGCIKICDPNCSKEYNKECNIYFNTNSYNWTIPYYSRVPITSVSGAKFNYIGADVNEINCGGYLSGTADANITNFVARIDAAAVADNRSVTKVREVNGNYIPKNNAPGDIIEDYSYVLGGESEGTIGYNLYDSQSAYQLSQNNADKLQLSMDYEDCYLEGGSAAGNKIVFDKEGYVSVSGESADYNISMTYDDTYPTDWFTIRINGENADEVSLEKENNGYILSGDNLENVEVSVNNKEDSAYARFTTKYPSIYIYEINEETVGVKVDADNNGTYETLLDTRNTHEYDSCWKTDDKNHWKECKCGEKSEINVHEFQWVIDQDATVFQSGLKHEECRICKYIRNKDTVIEKTVLEVPALSTVSPLPTNISTVNNNQNIKKIEKIGKISITTFQSKKKGRIFLKWNKLNLAKGYQVQYSLKKNFSQKKVRTKKSNSISLKGLKSKRKYYIRVRAYTQDSKRKWGEWSKVKSIKVK